MKFIRNVISSINEPLIFVGMLLFIAYFGTRNAMGLLPMVALIVVLALGVGFAIWLAVQQSQAADSYSESSPWIDKAVWNVALFLVGASLVTYIGTLL